MTAPGEGHVAQDSDQDYRRRAVHVRSVERSGIRRDKGRTPESCYVSSWTATCAPRRLTSKGRLPKLDARVQLRGLPLNHQDWIITVTDTSPALTMRPRSCDTPTKHMLLQLLATFFCLQTNDAARLLRNRAITPSDARSVRRTLSILHRDGFLYRVPHVDAGRDRGGIGYVYGLSANGVKHAQQSGYATTATKTLDEHSRRTLDHELEITSFHIALHRLCAVRGLRYGWRQTDLKHRVHPDAVFNVEDPARPGKAFCYFLEIERAKLGNYRNGKPQILRKLEAYYRYFNSTDCERDWGFRQYRVVVVQRSEARRDGLLSAVRKAFCHRMFWLTTEPLYRENIGGPIFMTPKDATPVPFSFLTS